MSDNTVRLSYQPLILTVAGQRPTVPILQSAKPGDQTWRVETDLLIGQHCFNIVDNKYYIRSANNGIVTLKSTMYHVHDQGVPSAIWTINHGLGCRPNVSVTDTGGQSYTGAVTYIDDNNLTIEFNSGFSGKAYLN